MLEIPSRHGWRQRLRNYQNSMGTSSMRSRLSMRCVGIVRLQPVLGVHRVNWRFRETLICIDDDTELDDLIYVNCTDYMEDMSSHEISALQRPSSPSYWRGRLSPEQQISVREDVNVSSGVGVLSGVPSSRNGGGGKIYTQNEFRSAHGASRNTSRAPSVHVDDFYSNS
jgi:hypothetical protein